jgi:serine/tyrosine/threonine adenylyltransferase
VRDLFIDREAADVWLAAYHARLAEESIDDAQRVLTMNAVNPKYVLRNYLAEGAIRKAREEQDYSEVATLLALLRRPFDEQAEFERYAQMPPDWAQHLEVSCSS